MSSNGTAACIDDAQCGQYQFCTRPSDGGGSGSGSSNTTAVISTSGLCTDRLPAGSACSRDSQCQSGVCSTNTRTCMRDMDVPMALIMGITVALFLIIFVGGAVWMRIRLRNRKGDAGDGDDSDAAFRESLRDMELQLEARRQRAAISAARRAGADINNPDRLITYEEAIMGPSSSPHPRSSLAAAPLTTNPSFTSTYSQSSVATSHSSFSILSWFRRSSSPSISCPPAQQQQMQQQQQQMQQQQMQQIIMQSQTNVTVSGNNLIGGTQSLAGAGAGAVTGGAAAMNRSQRWLRSPQLTILTLNSHGLTTIQLEDPAALPPSYHELPPPYQAESVELQRLNHMRRSASAPAPAGSTTSTAASTSTSPSQAQAATALSVPILATDSQQQQSGSSEVSAHHQLQPEGESDMLPQYPASVPAIVIASEVEDSDPH